MSDEIDLFDEEIEKYREIYESVIDDTQDEDFVDELFESSDGIPVKNWSMEDINKLIEDVETIPDVEEAGEDFDADRYQEYSEPEEADFSETESKEKEESYDENAVYFSKEYEQNLASKAEITQKIPTEYEDFFSVSEDYEETEKDIAEEVSESETQEAFAADVTETEIQEDFFEETTDGDEFIPVQETPVAEEFFSDVSDEEFVSVEGNINDAREDGEFKEIDESSYEDDISDNEVVYDGTFDRGDYLKIKDIFKKSKILNKRKVERAEVRENAMETVKEKYGEAVFNAKTSEGDFNEILRRQRAAELEKIEKEENQPVQKSVRFDLESQEYVSVSVASETKDEPVEEDTENKDDDLGDTIFVSDLSAFEEVAKENKKLPEDAEQTKIIGEKAEDGNLNNESDEFMPVEKEEINDDQLKFDGFSEDEEVMPDEVSNEEVSENLRKMREEKKNLFRITSLPSDYDDIDPNYFSPEKGKYDEEEHLVLSDENDPKSFFTMFKKSFIQEKGKKLTEYTTSNEKPQVFKELYDRRRRSVFGIVAMALLALVFVGLSAVFNSLEMMTTDAMSACVVSLSIVSMLLTFVFGSSVTQPGIAALSKGRITTDSAVVVVILISLLTSLASFFDLSGLGDNYPVYTVAVLLCVIFNCLGKTMETSRAIDGLKTVTTKRKNNLFTIQEIDDMNTAQNIGRVFAGDKPSLKYSCKTLFPGGFVYNSFASNPADRFVRVLFPAFAALSLIIAIIAGIVNQDIVVVFATWLAAVLASFPGLIMFTLNFSLSSVNKRLEKRNACITGYNSVSSIEKTDAVVVDAIDLFDISKCNFHGMKDFGTVRVDDIILYASAMLTNSRGPLAHVFDKAIIGDKNELLPEVEDLCYEERLGLSGWIRGEKVFVGNRNLIINHNMEAPPKGAEVACLKEGKKVLYIAIDGKVAAMLVVEYAKNEEMKKHLSKLQKNGITVVVTTNDCNIDEEFLSLEYNMPRECFKVVGDFEGGLLDGYIHRLRKIAPAKLVHDGTSLSFFDTFASALSYSSSVKLTFAVQIVMMLAGLITAAVFAFSGNLSVFTAGIVVLVQAIIAAIITAVAVIRTKL